MVLYQLKNGYCYNSDTHFLHQFISDCLKKYKNKSGNILDIGSGSGILGLLLLKKFYKLTLSQCELQEDFIFLSNKNAQINNIKNIMYEGNIFDQKFDQKFDLIVSNPPFYDTRTIKTHNQSKSISRYSEYMPLKKLLKFTYDLLSNNGKFFFCYSAEKTNEVILECNNANLNIESIKFLHPNITKNASLMMIYIKKNSKSSSKIQNPFLMFDDDGKFTQQTLEIYKTCNTHSIKVENINYEY